MEQLQSFRQLMQGAGIVSTQHASKITEYVKQNGRQGLALITTQIIDYNKSFPDIEGDAARDAIKHAAASAALANKFGRLTAKTLGDLKEAGGALTNYIVTPEDSWKDSWNNAVGLKINDYIEANQLGRDTIPALVIDALKSRHLIQQESDPRIVLDKVPQPTWIEPSPPCKLAIKKNAPVTALRAGL